MPLSLLSVGQTGRVESVTGPHDVTMHLTAMGFTNGTLVNVISKNSQLLVVSVRNSRVALDKKLANSVRVEAG